MFLSNVLDNCRLCSQTMYRSVMVVREVVEHFKKAGKSLKLTKDAWAHRFPGKPEPEESQELELDDGTKLVLYQVWDGHKGEYESWREDVSRTVHMSTVFDGSLPVFDSKNNCDQVYKTRAKAHPSMRSFDDLPHLSLKPMYTEASQEEKSEGQAGRLSESDMFIHKDLT